MDARNSLTLLSIYTASGYEMVHGNTRMAAIIILFSPWECAKNAAQFINDSDMITHIITVAVAVADAGVVAVTTAVR